MEKTYKFLNIDNQSPYQYYRYDKYLPQDGKPGRWLPLLRKQPVPCECGFHSCYARHLSKWVDDNLYETEYADIQYGFTFTESYEKVTGNKMRLVRKIESWTENNKRLYLAYCIREMMKQYNVSNFLLSAAVDRSERFARGEITAEELETMHLRCYKYMARLRDEARGNICDQHLTDIAYMTITVTSQAFLNLWLRHVSVYSQMDPASVKLIELLELEQ